VFDADDHRAAAEDLGGEHLPAGQADQAAVVDRAVDLDRRPVLGWRQRRRRAGIDRALDGRNARRRRDGGQAAGQPERQQLTLLVRRRLKTLLER
jgi:hypothetical protein